MIDLTKTVLFAGITPEELPPLLRQLDGTERHYAKGAVILPAGEPTERLGVVLSGCAAIGHDNVWGDHVLLSHVLPGEVFAEAYACVPQEPLMVQVSAVEDTEALFLRASAAPAAGERAYERFRNNLLSACAAKNLRLSRRMMHTSAKSIRGRLTSYFSECVRRAGSRTFDIPFNRQQLADYLGVERSALCGELSKMRRDGLLDYDKNHFAIREKEL